MAEVTLVAEWRRSFRHFRHFRHMSFLFRMSFCGFQFPEGALKYEIDPELTFQMAIEDYRRQGYSDKWINERMRSIEMRKIMHFELHFILGNRKNYCITSQ